jgi:hypothetical protein
MAPTHIPGAMPRQCHQSPGTVELLQVRKTTQTFTSASQDSTATFCEATAIFTTSTWILVYHRIRESNGACNKIGLPVSPFGCSSAELGDDVGKREQLSLPCI